MTTKILSQNKCPKSCEHNASPSAVAIRRATQKDIVAMVALSSEKRRAYEMTQPQFWKRSEGAEAAQKKWFNDLMAKKDHILLIAEAESNIVGFIIGRIVKSPEVYDPGGLTLMVDDFCVLFPTYWQSVGCKLLDHLKRLAKEKGVVQIVVVCGNHDEPKRLFIQNFGLNIASEWYVGDIR